MSQLTLWAAPGAVHAANPGGCCNPVAAPDPEGSRESRDFHPSGFAGALVTREQRNEAARVIRASVWRGTMPASPDRRPWSMGRELHVWRRLVCSGWNPDELTDALRMVRVVNPKVCRLTYLTRLDGPGILADAAQAWRALHAQAEVRPTRELGSISDILAGLGVA